jgi:serine/threonine protein kinase
VDDLIGRQLGGYVIESVIGQGGMARVFRARQARLDRICALKILRPELADDESFVRRFLREARSAARLEHPHIVPIYDTGEVNGFYFIAMKYLAGHSLREILDRGRLPLELVPSYVSQAAAALDYAHSQGVIHRDIKPGNIVIDGQGWLTLTDFGLARATDDLALTATGTLLGTPLYMAPEQVQGVPSTTRTDIYQFGIVVYELLCGETPFGARNTQAVLFAHLTETPLPVHERAGELDPAISGIVQKAVEKDPQLRYATAGAFAQALEAALDEMTQRRGLRGRPVIVPEPEQVTIFEDLEPPLLEVHSAEISTVERAAPQPAPSTTVSGAVAASAGVAAPLPLVGASPAASSASVPPIQPTQPPASPPLATTSPAAGGCSIAWLLVLGGAFLALLLLLGGGGLAWYALTRSEDPTATPTQEQARQATDTPAPSVTSDAPATTTDVAPATDTAPNSATPEEPPPTVTSAPATETAPPTPTSTLAPPPTGDIPPLPTPAAELTTNAVASWASFSGDWGESFLQRTAYIIRVNETSSGRIVYSGESYPGAIRVSAMVRFVGDYGASAFACMWVRYATDDTGTAQSGYRICLEGSGRSFAQWLSTADSWATFDEVVIEISQADFDPGAATELTIITRGKELWFQINGEPVGWISHAGAAEGRLAFEVGHDQVSGTSEAEFDNVRIWSVE